MKYLITNQCVMNRVPSTSNTKMSFTILISLLFTN